MKNYLLTKELLNELFYGSALTKNTIVSELEKLVQKNESMFISIFTFNALLEKETNIQKRQIIIKNLDILCEKVIILDKEDLLLAQGFSKQFAIDFYRATELLAANKANTDYILDITEDFKFQNMVSVVCLVLESKGDTSR